MTHKEILKEILALEPGEKLDERLAEKLEIWKPGVACDGRIIDARGPISGQWECIKCGTRGYLTVPINTRHYKAPPLSQSWEGVGLVARAMREMEWFLMIEQRRHGYVAWFEPSVLCSAYSYRWFKSVHERPTAPYAVAVGALLALEGAEIGELERCSR